MGAALVDHDRIVRSAIAGRDGHIFSTAGDGYGVAFSRAIDAVEAGVSAQQGLTEHVWPQNVALRVRMGVHTGEVQERDGDYFGPPVNRAARLMGSAHGGQLVVSALTAQLLGNDHDLKLIDLGEVALKGIVDPVHVFGVSAEGLAWLDRPLVSAQPTAGNLPRPQTEMVGNLATLQERVAVLPQAGLVTLTGSGGVGKTRG